MPEPSADIPSATSTPKAPCHSPIMALLASSADENAIVRTARTTIGGILDFTARLSLRCDALHHRDLSAKPTRISARQSGTETQKAGRGTPGKPPGRESGTPIYIYG